MFRSSNRASSLQSLRQACANLRGPSTNSRPSPAEASGRLPVAWSLNGGYQLPTCLAACLPSHLCLHLPRVTMSADDRVSSQFLHTSIVSPPSVDQPLRSLPASPALHCSPLTTTTEVVLLATHPSLDDCINVCAHPLFAAHGTPKSKLSASHVIHSPYWIVFHQCSLHGLHSQRAPCP